MKIDSKIAIWWSVPWTFIGAILFWLIGIPLRGLFTGWFLASNEIDKEIDKELADEPEEKE